jgi:hypothetical protein
MIRIANTWTTNRTRRAGAEQSDEYLVVRHLANNMPEEATREGIDSSELVLGFPFQRGQPTFHPPESLRFSTNQRVWVSLPSTSRLRPYCEPGRYTSAGHKGGDSGFEHRRLDCGTPRMVDHQRMELASP